MFVLYYYSGLLFHQMPSRKNDTLFDKVLWFLRRERFDIDFFELLLPRRIVSQDPRYRSGVFHSDKCGRDIQYESALELGFIKRLEEHEEVAFYWEQPVRIRYRRGRKQRTYTPDFAIYLKSREVIIAEVKDLSGMLDHRVQLKAEALMEFCSSHGFGLLLTDGRNTPDKLLKCKCNRRLEKALSDALKVNPLSQEECRELMNRCGATRNELYKAIIRQNLKFRSFPFKLQKGNEETVFRQVFFGKRSYDELAAAKFSAMFGGKDSGTDR